MRFVHYWPAPPSNYYQAQLVQDFADKVTKRTDGYITIQVYPAGQLAKGNEIAGVVAGKQHAFGGTSLSYIAANVPSSGFFNLGELIPTKEENQKKVWYGMIGDMIQEELKAKYGLKILGFNSFGQSTMYGKDKPIRNPDDIKGLNLRVSNAFLSAVVKAIGANPVSMSSSNIYMSMQQGLIDGFQTGFTGGASRKLYEVANYVTSPGFTSTVAIYVMHEDVFNDVLTPEQQEIVLATAKETFEDNFVSSIRDAEGAAIEIMKNSGINIYNKTKEDTAAWSKVWNEIGYPIWEASLSTDKRDKIYAELARLRALD
ncbi:TRAP transporter substrate-binding protein [Chloroflexota bacterium]